jgi:type I restriction-modification system DNA methylase subunit
MGEEQAIKAFIERWRNSGAAERANCQIFLSELCALLGVEPPEPATPDTSLNAYVFERDVTFHHGDGSTSTGRIDLYKRGHFVLEAKQGANDQKSTDPLEPAQKLKKGTAKRGTVAWDDAMLRARGQAEQYIRALPAEEGRPPFLVVVDVGHSIELYSEFSCTGGTYIPFPAPGSHRIFLRDLERPDIRERLKKVWEAPNELDPSKRSARVTREIADHLAALAKTLEADGHAAEPTAAFLMRCLFTMFAEDVNLLTRNSFTNLLESLADTPEHFVPMVEELWQKMNTGGFSTTLRTNILQFNGGLFAENTALPLTKNQLRLLIEAARADWRDVEPAIFGTLLERALNPVERHKLGAHYTPRAYVERLVLQTVINPVRSEWEAVRIAAANLAGQDKIKEAVAELRKYHRALCHIRVLDPACGSGNFLYVVLEHLKRIEGEIFDTLFEFGEGQGSLDMAGETVDPHQLLGLEINPRAAAIAELVLWIGTLQWHFRNRGSVYPPQPIIRNFHNIECRDALIEFDDRQEVPGVTHWDGRTTKPHPVTGKEVPDEAARIPVYKYSNPRKTVWPEADYIIGNPPFIGASRMRDALGDGYTDTVRAVHSDVGESSDFVMYWWNHAAELLRAGTLNRFGFVTTNSISQKFNRRVIERHMEGRALSTKAPRGRIIDLSLPVSLIYAIPDHPWVDAADGAAVRIAMTTAKLGEAEGLLQTVTQETESESDGYEVALASKRGKLHPDLTIGANLAGAVPLLANNDLSNRGVCLFGKGFIVTREEAEQLGLGRIQGLENHIREYRNGKDLTAKSRNVMVIDLFGLTAEEVRSQYPTVYQWVLERVKPERDNNKRVSRRENWWLFGETNPKLRKMLAGLPRYIATVETSKHRFFQFLEETILPDNKLISIALDDAYLLGLLSSRIHVGWAMASGGNLGVGNDSVYVKSRCFEAFPFPEATEGQKARIRSLGEQLDAHRKRQQEQHPGLMMTGMYNVLTKLRSGEALTPKEKTIHEQGLVSVLMQLHDELDAAVAEAYGWPADLADDEILERLVALNAVRAAEEAQGHIRYLRPAFQCPEAVPKQGEFPTTTPGGAPGLHVGPAPDRARDAKKQPWPQSLPDQVQALRAALAAAPSPATAEQLARNFSRAQTKRVADLLETLATLGQAQRMDGGRYATS